ncbi:MAG: hypothetical protein QXX95_08535 [Nitrososphaerales archaeon]
MIKVEEIREFLKRIAKNAVRILWNLWDFIEYIKLGNISARVLI